MKTIFKVKFGSHLYGTNTPLSDTDYKGVFIASLDDIILKKDSRCLHDNTKKGNQDGVRNTVTDIDIEYKELREFINDCCTGQTYALDMLFAPENMWIESNEIWRDIILNRDKLLSKNIQPYIGYCRRQAAKYGLKGSRLGELIRVIEHLEKKDPKITTGEATEDLADGEFAFKTINASINQGKETKECFLEVLGKKFQLNRFVHETLFSLNNLRQRYGARAELARNNEGIDWKAISHAYRCCYQLKELAETGVIIFPLKAAEKIKQIKQGALLKLNYTEIQDELYLLMEDAIEKIEKSNLPINADRKFWDSFILNIYKNG